MIINPSDLKGIQICREAVDLRKGIDGYAALVQNTLNLDPFDGSLYLFTNRAHNKVKGILYNGKGFWLFYFRPESGRFKWRISKDGKSAQITQQQMEWLFNGMAMENVSAFEERRPIYA